MAWAVEMASYWFLCLPVCDAVAMSVEADVEGFLCLSNVLLSALPAFDQVGHVPCLAGGCSTYVDGLFRGRTLQNRHCSWFRWFDRGTILGVKQKTSTSCIPRVKM